MLESKMRKGSGSFREVAQEAEHGRLVRSFHADEERNHRERLLYGQLRLSRQSNR